MFEFTQDLAHACETFDLRSYLEAHGFEPEPNGEWSRTCPECMKPGKLTCRLARRRWQCWVCVRFGLADVSGRRRVTRGGGGVLRLVRWVERCSFAEAVAIVFAGAREPTVPIEALPDLELVSDVVEGDVEPEPVPPPEGAAPIVELPYLERRGLTRADVEAYGLFWCPWGRYAGRLVFPVWWRRSLLYWQARATWESGERPGRYIKALNPPRQPGAAVSSEVLLGAELAAQYPRVAICEGPIDAIHAGPSAVCTFGKRLTAAQIACLVRLGVRAVDLVWDGPSATEPDGAWPEMVEAAPRLALFFDTRLVRLPADDPGSYSREQIDEFRLKNSVPAASVSRLARI